MRLLFTSSPGVGHLLPILSVAVAARDAGHEVVVGCGASLVPLVERAGLTHAVVGRATIEEVWPLIPGFAEAVGPARVNLMLPEGFARLIAGPMADDVLGLMTDWRPDVLVHEDLELGGWVAAERLGIPHVTIQATAYRPDKRALVISNLNELRVRFGLAADPGLTGRDGTLWFTTRPPALRDPAVRMPAGLRELRPEPDDRVGGAIAEPPDWLARTPARPRIAVTLGTINAYRVDLFRAIVDGLADVDADVVVALGADPATLGEAPANVRVERYVAMSLLLPRSTVVVHHGGSGTTLAALAAGRPSAFVPISGDQPVNAAHTAAAGAGVTLDATTLTPADVRVAVARLLADRSFANRAGEIAAEIAAMPDATAALAEIEALV